MATIQRGARGKLSQYGNDGRPMVLRMHTDGPATYDCTCFGLDAEGKLSDDRYMIFYNQPESPFGEVAWQESADGADFALDLSMLPASIDKLAFTVSIDGTGTMGQVRSCSIELVQDGNVIVECRLSGSQFSSETAVIAAEIYRKPDWRVAAVMRGFNGGLGDLLRDYGGEEETTDGEPSAPALAPPEPAPAPAPSKIDLKKKLEKAPALINLAKPLTMSLEKYHLAKEVARVALVMDISGSMTERYRNGTVQAVVNKTLPLAVQFDDDGNLDFWYYGSRCEKRDDVTLDNYMTAVPKDWKRLMRRLGFGNNEPAVMRKVIDFYKETDVPAYVLFVTDGGVSEEKRISKLLREASKKPIFWQFVGVGGWDYGVLERLDEMPGRYVDNAGFFALDDFKTVPDATLYDRLLTEFPQWLKAVRRKGMI